MLWSGTSPTIEIVLVRARRPQGLAMMDVPARKKRHSLLKKTNAGVDVPPHSRKRTETNSIHDLVVVLEFSASSENLLSDYSSNLKNAASTRVCLNLWSSSRLLKKSTYAFQPRLLATSSDLPFECEMEAHNIFATRTFAASTRVCSLNMGVLRDS